MVAIYGVLSRFSGCVAGLCAVLALLATPAAARADLAGCEACCQGFQNEEYSECVGDCMASGGTCNFQASCANPCGAGEYPLCGNGKCDKILPDCSKHSCKLTADSKFCECTSK